MPSAQVFTLNTMSAGASAEVKHASTAAVEIKTVDRGDIPDGILCSEVDFLSKNEQVRQPTPSAYSPDGVIVERIPCYWNGAGET
jgi:hypothetical protein